MSDVVNVIIPTFVISVSLMCCCVIIACSFSCCTSVCNKESNKILPLNSNSDYIVIINPDNKLSLGIQL
jgi:hypothetical protein